MEVSGPLGRLCRVEVRWREDAPSFEAVSVSGPPPGFKQVSPTQLDFEEASHQQGELQPFLEASMAASMFPHIGRVLPGPVLAELLGLSRLVGMNCPGLRSIFAALEVEFDGYGSGAALIRYRVGSCDVRFSSLNIEVRGRCLRGTVLAIVRPLPQKQASMAEVVGQVRAGEFAGQCALVIGGSRGLGEVATKIIAAGGGRPIITYHRGVDDAERVAAEVRRAGAKCTVAQCDVGRPAKAMSGLHQQGLNPTHIYFFASSKILPNRTNEFKRTLYKKFSESYVEGLSNSYRAARRQWRGPLAMFYPSTVFIDERPIGFAEYIAAKAAGEALCGYLEQTDVKLRILVKRLPRLATDQTGSSLARKEQDPLEVMREVVGGMHALGPAGDAT